jgi:hypothetical protein
MKIIFRTQSDNPEYSADCDYAVVDMTPALWQEIRRRVETARQSLQTDGDLYTLCFWGGTAEFYSCRLIEACEEAIAAETEGNDKEKSAAAWAWSAQFDDPGYVLLPSGVDLDKYQPERTECDQMIVRCVPSGGRPEFEVAWTAIPKHTDIHVATRDMPLAAIEACVRNEILSGRAPAP